MLNPARFPTQFHYNVVLHNPTVKLFQFPPKPHLSNSPRLNWGDFLVNGLRCNALGTKKKVGFGVKEMDSSDEFGDDEFIDFSEMEDVGGGYDDDDDDDDDEVVIPLKNMKQWLQNRPRGFGEGKVYDTTIEDKLMEEIEQSRRAQLANVNKLKNNPVNQGSKNETSKKDKGGPQHGLEGFRVRLVNLPKKKNIHRDLRAAFQGVPGIVNIVPVVSGNEKTRDPVCKGLAFVDFKTKDEAQRFMQNFSGKPIAFGKVEKQIKCEMVKPQVLKPECDQLSYSLGESELDDDADARHVTGEWEEDDGDEGIDSVSTTSDSHLADEQRGEEEETSTNSFSLKQTTRRPKKHQKKVASTRVKGDTLKLNIPGSAKKLKIQEQAVLSGVFSKYGAAAPAAATAATVNEHRHPS